MLEVWVVKWRTDVGSMIDDRGSESIAGNVLARLSGLRLYLFVLCLLGVSSLASVVALLPSRYAPPWMHTGQESLHSRYLVFYVSLIAILLVLRRPALRYADSLVEWLNRPTYRQARFKMCVVVSLALAAYFTQSHIFIFHRGVNVWNYQGKKYDSGLDGTPVISEIKFLHFEKGEMLRYNLGLTNFSFSKSLPEKLSDRIRLIRYSLKYRQANRRFLLPVNLSNPIHQYYYPFPYESYPPVEELVGISKWRVEAIASPSSQVDVLSAELVEYGTVK